MFESKEKKYIDNAQKYLDSRAPKPQLTEYEIIPESVFRFAGWDDIVFYDKNNNAIVAYEYDFATEEIKDPIGRHRYKFPTKNFEELVGFRLDLTITRQRNWIKSTLYHKTQHIRTVLLILSIPVLIISIPIIEASNSWYLKIKDKFFQIKNKVKNYFLSKESSDQ